MANTRDLIGRLRTRARIEANQAAPTDTNRGAFGSLAEGWEEVATVCCCVEPLAGVERWLGVQIQAAVTHGVVFRWFPDFRPTAAMRLTGHDLGTRVLHFAGPPRDLEEKHEWYLVQAIETVAGA